MAQAVPRFAELNAPPDWRTADFISDLHLHESEPATFEAWRTWMSAATADAVFILGDLFEVWVGDDAASDGFEASCAAVLRDVAARRPVFFMHGNRDFLVGRQFLADLGVTLLDDPTVLVFAGARWLLSHGDMLCLADVDYLKFREQVRGSVWQEAFLSKPLGERRTIARALRAQSETRKHSALAYADVDDAAVRDWLKSSGAGTLIHGHTHRPADHLLGDGFGRVVLSDWDLAAVPPRAQVLRLTAGGLKRLPLV
jgi:UDP-2,3-diacylglucosamine hydrolase